MTTKKAQPMEVGAPETETVSEIQNPQGPEMQAEAQSSPKTDSAFPESEYRIRDQSEIPKTDTENVETAENSDPVVNEILATPETVPKAEAEIGDEISSIAGNDKNPETDTENAVEESGEHAFNPVALGDSSMDPVKSGESEIGITEEPQKAKNSAGRKRKTTRTSKTDTEMEPLREPEKKSEEIPETETEMNLDMEDAVNAHSPERPRKRTSSRPIRAVVSIDNQRTVETDEDKAKNDLLDLVESLRTGRILTGTVQGVERTADDNEPLAVIYHGVFKIIIPAMEAVEPPDDYREMSPKDVHHYLLTKRLGAEIDFVVKGIDPKTNIAVASRLEAMRMKRKQYYFGTDREGNNLLYAGICAEARVVSVIRAGIFVDLFGVEVYIPLRELSYQRMLDASGYFQPGQRILVKVLEIDKTDRNNLKVKASVKQAAENPYEKALRKYTVGNRYVGTVSMVDTNGVFVALDGGIDCLCSYPKRGRPPRGARVTVRILGINHETNRIWGAITHTASPR